MITIPKEQIEQFIELFTKLGQDYKRCSEEDNTGIGCYYQGRAESYVEATRAFRALVLFNRKEDK